MARTLLGVAGWPVGHSRSPAMHNAALAELGLDWLYVPLPLPPHRFEGAVRALPGSDFRGINVTVPHKPAALALADARSPAAAAIGAANTLTFSAGGAIEADNTDAAGLLDALDRDVAGERAVVLGAGGSARAAAWALREAGAEVTVTNRTRERARELARDLGIRAADHPEDCDLLVNCTSVGLGGGITRSEALAALRLEGSRPPATVVDLVYGASPTQLTLWARECGARAIDGLEVLVHQGARSLASWTGAPTPVQTMALAARGDAGVEG